MPRVKKMPSPTGDHRVLGCFSRVFLGFFLGFVLARVFSRVFLMVFLKVFLRFWSISLFTRFLFGYPVFLEPPAPSGCFCVLWQIIQSSKDVFWRM